MSKGDPKNLDSEPILSEAPDNMSEMLIDSISKIQIKLFGLMFLIFMFLSTDIFINRVLSHIPNAVDMKTPTNWGVAIQATILTICMIFIDVLINQHII